MTNPQIQFYQMAAILLGLKASTVWVRCPDCSEDHPILVGQLVTDRLVAFADRIHGRN